MTMKSKPIPKYVEEILKLQPIIKPGTVTHVTVYHDDWCDLLNGKGQCNCKPTVKLGVPREFGKTGTLDA